MNKILYSGESKQSVNSEHRSYLQEFIDIYRQKEPLWNTKHPHYAKTHIRNLCYDALAEKMKEMIPNATRDDVVKKINTIRCTFRKEYRKVCHANILGRPYKPKLWYYDNLLFLLEQEPPPPGVRIDRSISTDEVESDQAEPSEQHDDITYTRRALRIEASTTVKRRRNKPGKAEAHADIFGRHVAAKLSMVPQDQRVFLEKLINDAIFEAELGNLGRDSMIVLE